MRSIERDWWSRESVWRKKTARRHNSSQFDHIAVKICCYARCCFAATVCDTIPRDMMRGTKDFQVFQDKRWNACALFLAPTLVAVVVVTGLLALSIENVSGALAAREAHRDHAAAIQRLFFRP